MVHMSKKKTHQTRVVFVFTSQIDSIFSLIYLFLLHILYQIWILYTLRRTLKRSRPEKEAILIFGIGHSVKFLEGQANKNSTLLYKRTKV